MNSLMSLAKNKIEENLSDENPIYNEYEIISAAIQKVVNEFLIKSSKEKYFIEEQVFDISRVTYSNHQIERERKLLKRKKYQSSNKYDTSREKNFRKYTGKRIKIK